MDNACYVSCFYVAHLKIMNQIFELCRKKTSLQYVPIANNGKIAYFSIKAYA